jgi:hypothetical protein
MREPDKAVAEMEKVCVDEGRPTVVLKPSKTGGWTDNAGIAGFTVT